MFKNWSNILGYDCEVIEFKNHQIIYPIFKNGKTSLENYAIYNKLKIFKNKEISKFQKIVVFLRDPEERFVSGVHTYLEYKKIQCIKEDEQCLNNICTKDSNGKSRKISKTAIATIVKFLKV